MSFSFPLLPLTEWFPPEPFPDLSGIAIATRFRELLASTDSLTRRLERLTGLESRVRIEEQSVQQSASAVDEPLWDARYRLPGEEAVLTRNAWLRLGSEELVFAHSQLALNGMDPPIRSAIVAGDQPLGSLFLARDEQVERRHLQLAACRAPGLAARIARNPDHPFIVRRSLFLVAGVPCGRILELFLTDLSR
ncbi:MAG: chorismate pyruvate-lyase family protein [Magnetococcus sp. YQC-9]